MHIHPCSLDVYVAPGHTLSRSVPDIDVLESAVVCSLKIKMECYLAASWLL